MDFLLRGEIDDGERVAGIFGAVVGDDGELAVGGSGDFVGAFAGGDAGYYFLRGGVNDGQGIFGFV